MKQLEMDLPMDTRHREIVTRTFHFCEVCIQHEKPRFRRAITSVHDKAGEPPNCCADCGKTQHDGFMPGQTKNLRVEFDEEHNVDPFWHNHWRLIVYEDADKGIFLTEVPTTGENNRYADSVWGDDIEKLREIRDDFVTVLNHEWFHVRDNAQARIIELNDLIETLTK